MTEKEKYQMDWFRLAMQYYIAARFSHYALCSPTFGNLFHHAIEMALKGYLSHGLPIGQLRKYSHKLVALWEEFTKRIADPALKRFDQTIHELNKFEEIRYPDSFPEGMEVIAVGGAELVERTEDASGHYQLHVHEVDELLVTIFEKSSVDPQKYTSRLPSVTRMYMEADNPVASKLLRPGVCE
jgi:hypothetical protein